MEAEIIACEKKEEFALYHINRLLNSDFGKKPRKSCALTPTSPIGPPPVAITNSCYISTSTFYVTITNSQPISLSPSQYPYLSHVATRYRHYI